MAEKKKVASLQKPTEAKDAKKAVKSTVATGEKVAAKIAGKLTTAVKATEKRKIDPSSPAKAPEVAQKSPKASKPVSDTKKEPKERKASPRHFIVDMLLERKYTDEEILAKVEEKFGKGLYTTKKAYVQLTRADLNAGLIKQPIVDGRMKDYVGKIVVDEATNKKVEQPYKPSALRKTGFQFKLATA